LYGENLQAITRRCVCCGKHVAMRVDPEDVARHAAGVFVQHAFVRRDGTPYLTSAEREMFPACSGVCAACWGLLCPSSPLAYS
jgi:hypothetical protein